MTCYISYRDVSWELLSDGYKITVITDVASHLIMRYSLNPPQYHTVPVLRRGLFLHGDRYFCFTAYHENEQEEAGDVLVHTFIKTMWPSCQTRYFYFYGSIAGEWCVSVSPVFKLHFLAPPVQDFYPTWHNRQINSNAGTWLSARFGANLATDGKYQRPQHLLTVDTHLVGLYAITRAWINFHTDDIPAGKTVIGAKLGLFVTTKTGIVSTLFITKGLCREPITEDSWAVQTAEVTSLGLINQADILAGQFNWIDLNADGIAWINQSVLELKQHESFDWSRNAYFRTYGAIRNSESFKPLFGHYLKKLRLRLKRAGNAGTLYVNITDTTPNGCSDNLPLAQDSMVCLLLSTATWGRWEEVTFDHPPYVQDGHTYAIEIWCSGGNSSNYVDWIANTSTAYPSGHACSSPNSGATWTSYPAWCLHFIEYECSNWDDFESRCDSNVGGTNFCLRTGFDLNNIPPTPGQTQVVTFYSAQIGVPWCPILRLTFD